MKNLLITIVVLAAIGGVLLFVGNLDREPESLDGVEGSEKLNVDNLMNFKNIHTGTVYLPPGASFSTTVVYADNIDEGSLAATLNGVDVSNSFNPRKGTVENVELLLEIGPNQLITNIREETVIGKSSARQINNIVLYMAEEPPVATPGSHSARMLTSAPDGLPDDPIHLVRPENPDKAFIVDKTGRGLSDNPE